MVLSVLAFWALHASFAFGQIVPEDEQRIRWQNENSVSRFRRSAGPAPVTVATEEANTTERFLPLDETIRLALQHSEVIRVLTGVSASSSGRTIYDTAIAITPIDVAKANFDPVFRANSEFRRNDLPGLNGLGTGITGQTTAGNDTTTGISDRNMLGGVADLAARNSWDSQDGQGFISRNVPTLEMSYTQPILAGFGTAANRAPIVIARLQQEQSYFRFKGSVQELVRGVIEVYWSLVQARTDLWAREIQVDRLQKIFDFREAQGRAGIRDVAVRAQAKASLMNAKAQLLQARGNVLQREAAMRNLIGLPPEDGFRLVPSTPPTRDRIEFRWDEIVETAQNRRPDLIELNLVLMADQQSLIRNRNLAQPSLDAVAVHRWNGLSGRLAANGNTVHSPFDQSTGWTMGVNFEVPLSLRASRANVRNQELLIARDRANIQQSIHQIEHLLATTLRSVDLNLEQYEAFRESRIASRENVGAQFARRDNELVVTEAQLPLLIAISDWANAVSAEAQSLTSYNSDLASLELQTGTILDTHGIRFTEEQFASIGPHGCLFEDTCYPRDLRPKDNEARYPDSGAASEEAFELDDLPQRKPEATLPLPDLELPKER
jgi:outer membrane protein TolC